MQFKYPELLYALLLLIIPIIVHLFQLRKFQKTQFTNVKFLKSITLQTRRSSQIKKWLALLTRMLLLACIILAFAQPYFSESNDFTTKNETVIYLDNSFSMQAAGPNGTLLNSAIQEIIEYVDENEPITIFTNTKSFPNTTIKAIKNDLITLPYSSNQLSWESIKIKARDAFLDEGNSVKTLIMVSDFQRKDANTFSEADTTFNNKIVQLRPSREANVSIDSIYIKTRKPENTELGVTISNYGRPVSALPVSLYNNDKLVAKTSVDVDDTAETSFVISADELFEGRVEIEDPNLLYDNILFFNIDNRERIKVLSINNADDTFLQKIYTEDQFEYLGFPENAVNFKLISEQNLIVLNELENINISLNTALQAFADDGGSVLVIPSNAGNIATYNQLLGQFGASRFDSLVPSSKRITEINFSHPLLENVFEKRVSNFQYPRVNSYFSASSPSNSKVLGYEDGSAFLYQVGPLYGFTAELSDENSNFKNSPLIVPALYNIGKQSLKISDLYYIVGQEQKIDVGAQLSQDEILSLETETNSVIPLQQTYSRKVQLTTQEFPENAGIVTVTNKGNPLKKLSFNYERSESNLTYHDLSEFQGYTIQNSVADAWTDVKSITEVDELWKWFVIFALILLVVEILILKYLK